MKKKDQTIRVVELFAGVGGFRVAFDRINTERKQRAFNVVWSNQWEPGAKVQHASEIYVRNFGPEGHSNEDIQKVIEEKFHEVSDHDLLVGGFPCQDYSVARTASQAAGLVGKKGVLWWSIYNILKKKGKDAPDYLMLENVDRLLKSPTSQRGRDFAIMLASVNELGYAVEWRVINAADYGMPQRRRRIFILGFKKGTKHYEEISRCSALKDWVSDNGVIVKAFPIKREEFKMREFKIEGSLAQVSERFSADKPSKSPFENAGVMVGGKVSTVKVLPDYNGEAKHLKDILEDEGKVPAEFYIREHSSIKEWKRLKGAKKEPRKAKNGHIYNYSEGPMPFPDPLDRASRTIVTGEGGAGPSRFKHVVEPERGKFRRLVPEELERLNMFERGHTKLMLNDKVTPNTKRAFLMGNALVVGVVERLGKSLLDSLR